MSEAPSAYRIEQALSAWQSARARLLNDDAELAHDEAALTELLGAEGGDVESVLVRLLRGAVHAASQASAAADQIETLKGRHDRYKRRSEAMRQTAFAVLDAIGRRKIELPDLTATISAGRASVVITDETAVPDIYAETITTRKLDKATIASVLNSGGAVPGAQLSNGLPSLAIRTR